jgi:hypothetical protein
VSPEQWLALFAALLCGAAVLWLGTRALRARRARLSMPSPVASQPVRSPQPSPEELAALVGRDGYWVCLTCRSLNRREAKHCYACKAVPGSAGQPAPGAPQVRRTAPVKARDVTRSASQAGGKAVTLAASGKAGPAPEAPVRDPDPVSPDAPRRVTTDVSICPLLGFRDDPSTRCSFPDTRNRCHATSKRGATLFAVRRRLIPGKTPTTRSRPIDPEHQRSSCLSATYEKCARYPAAQAVAANR